MNTIKYLILLISIVSVRSHDGLFSLNLDGSSDLEKLKQLGMKYQLEWLDGLHVGEVEFKSDSETIQNQNFNKDLRDIGLEPRVVVENLDKMIEKEQLEEELRGNTMKRSGTKSIISSFPRHSEINNWLKVLKKKYPKLVKLVSLGKSYEKRDMLMAKLSIGGGKNKKILLMDGGIHAREWLSIGSVIYILNKIVEGHTSKDANVIKMLSQYDVYILPVLNPDGYEKTKSKNFRLWRKNTQPVSKNCTGIDLNRNFDIDFGRTGVDMNPCSPIYPGDKPFTTPETKNFKSFVMKNLKRIQIYINFHAYSQMLFVPYGFTTKPPPDHKEAMMIASKMVDAIKQTSGIKYIFGSAAKLLYPSSGGIDDWAKSMGVKYTFCFEVRPNMTDKKYGFLVPPSFIKPTGEELYASVIAGVKSINHW